MFCTNTTRLIWRCQWLQCGAIVILTATRSEIKGNPCTTPAALHLMPETATYLFMKCSWSCKMWRLLSHQGAEMARAVRMKAQTWEPVEVMTDSCPYRARITSHLAVITLRACAARNKFTLIFHGIQSRLFLARSSAPGLLCCKDS